MKYFIQGKGPISLTDNQFLSQGGEGKIYVKGQTAYKIFLDSSRMIPKAKIQELSTITNPNVIKPELLILDEKNNVIGHTMKYIQDTFSLCQLFNQSFKDRNNIDYNKVIFLVKKLQDLISSIHNKNILIVDLNELNFLLDQKFEEIYAIDTGTYQTPSFPATALMDSIKDYHTKGFSELTDWFSFAIISCQMFLGIHPYKGKHSQYKLLEERMRNNISIFNKSVSIPPCNSFDVIPKIYRDWYQAVLEQGKRLPPPKDLQAVVILNQVINHIVGNDNFDINQLFKLKDSILDVFYIGDKHYILTKKQFIFGKEKIDLADAKDQFAIVTPKFSNPILASIVNQKLHLYNVNTRENIKLDISAEKLFKSGDQLYIKSRDHILEISFINDSFDAKNITAMFTKVANVLEKASSVYDGVVIQNMLGSKYISVFPKSGYHKQIRVKELDSSTIIDAKYQNNVLMLIINKKGSYERWVFRFQDSEYDLRIVKDTNPIGLNFVVLDNGICISINDDNTEESLEIFSNKKDSFNLNVIKDSHINKNMKLFFNGLKVLFSRDNALYSFAMKKK